MFRNIIIIIATCVTIGSTSCQDTVYINLKTALDIINTNNANYVNVHLQEHCNAEHLKSLALDLEPTDFVFEYGQLYTPENGWKLEVSQDFGTLFNQKKKRQVEQLAVYMQTDKNLLKKKNIELEMKALYFEWIYRYSLLENTAQLQDYLSESIYVSGLRDELGDSEPVENLKMISLISEIETSYFEQEIDIDILRNKLRKLLNNRSYFLPMNRTLDLYQVQKKYDTSRYTGKYVTDIYLDKYNYSGALVETKKPMRETRVQAGFFLQEVGGMNTMAGIRAGLSIPILSNSSKKDRIAYELQNEMDYNLYRQSIHVTELEIENLMLHLDGLFIRLRHYQNHALPAAHAQLNVSSVKYKLEEIEFDRYIVQIQEALSIKRDYLQVKNEYNQTAIKLELYTK